MTAGTDPTAATDRRVSPFELFFDLVFVFALTQVTASLAHDLNWTGLAHGLLIFAVLWWAWGSYAWLTNAVPTEGNARLIVLGAMAAMLVVALAVPTAWDGSGPAFALAYLMVMVLHAVLYTIGDEREETSRAILRFAPTNFGPGLLLLAAGYSEGTLQAVLWVAAVVLTYLGPYVAGMEGWQTTVPHFVERHALVLIIALGESIVAIGAGATGTVDVKLATSALLAVAVASSLWWAYFTGEADHAEHALDRETGLRQAILARDVYSYLHIPLVVGIVLAALGIKLTLGHPDDPLHEVAATALGGGVALYFAGLAAIRVRIGQRPHVAHVVAVPAALLAIPIGIEVTALAALAWAAAVAAAAAVAHSNDRFARLDARA